ncbi:hypothetical protein KZI27_02270 [Curtobacterium sp. TC1]|uniref:AlbA family DNA-binding domain-containing protein n=1 Tax=Curtobacterium sp. TC1 TaxID=2862880 RepID=UPI001C9A94B9|nr:hypothetical protein [Curtobacterium sp. TC1]QZQ55715.1 hypothetical protein KZI27_02270 [Curtobacterium sp. TC1]
MPSVHFSRRDEEWVVQGERGHHGPAGELVLKVGNLPNIQAAELRAALRSNAAFYDSDDAVALVSAVPDEYFDEDGIVDNVGFALQGDVLVVTLDDVINIGPDEDERGALERVRALLTPMLSRRSAVLHSARVDDLSTASSTLVVTLVIRPSTRGRSAQELFALGKDAARLLDALMNAAPSRMTVADLVRGGGADLLIGLPEGDWLDAKKLEYAAGEASGEISLAQAVARFANGDAGGVVVFGAATKKVPGGEVIRAVDGVNARPGSAARYLRALDRRLYPPVAGLRVDEVPTSAGKTIIVIEVPPQGEELKPFLVHGAILADGRTEGAFISIVQRRGEGSIPITAPMIHASLAAGRALLRREYHSPD